MLPDSATNRGFVDAFREIARRIADSLEGAPQSQLPVKMYVAGGVALHFHTAHRCSLDVDAWFSHPLWLPDDLEVSYRDADGKAQVLYFDRQHNNTFGLMHPDADDDAEPLSLPDADSGKLEVCVLSALDLAVCKTGRFGERDRGDIAALAERGLIDAESLRRRAEEAAQRYIGNQASLKTSIDVACRLVAGIEASGGTPGVPPPPPVPA